MATPKTWTAADVRQGKLTINRNGTALHIERRYQFEDDAGELLDQVAGGRLVANVDWSTLPPNIQAALLEIDTWTYNQILAKEGMT